MSRIDLLHIRKVHEIYSVKIVKVPFFFFLHHMVLMFVFISSGVRSEALFSIVCVAC